jgi:hypothetical protein
VPKRDEDTYSLYGVTIKTSFNFRYNLKRSTDEPELLFTYDGVRQDELEGKLVYERPSPRPGGESLVQLYVDGDKETIHFPGACTFSCGPTAIRAFSCSKGLEYLVEIRFVGEVMAYWLERRGSVALHASAVMSGNAAIAFLAGSTGGKTTLACAFVASGDPLISDDILRIECDESGVTAFPSLPQMKLLPEQLDHFWSGREPVRLVHPRFEKRIVPIGGEFGSFRDRPLPLAAIYILDSEISQADGLSLEPISPADAMPILISSAFAADMIDAVDRSSDRLNRLAQIAQTVPMKLLSVPRGYDRLQEARSVIASDQTRHRDGGQT